MLSATATLHSFSVAVGFLLVFARAEAAVVVGAPRAEPAAIAANTSTAVLFTSAITGGIPLTGGVNLLRISPTGQAAVVAQMHDDGVNGDVLAADGLFSALLTLNETGGPITFKVSAAFKGQLLRVQSPVTQLGVNSQTSQETRLTVANALANRDNSTAYRGFGERLNDIRFLDTLASSSVDALVQGLRSCSPTTTTAHYELCVASFTDLSGDSRSYQFVSVRDLFGVWRIIVW
jgi:hypothetical protein